MAAMMSTSIRDHRACRFWMRTRWNIARRRRLDLVRLIKTAEMLPQYAAQSTAVVCNDVPKSIGDLYRLFLVLWYSDKPIVTGSFNEHTTQVMIDLLALDCGGRDALKAKPRAVFDVCPSPPLNWSGFASQN